MEFPENIRSYQIKGKLGEGGHTELFMVSLPPLLSVTGDINSNSGKSQRIQQSTCKSKSKDQYSFAIKRISLAQTTLKIEDIIKETNAMVQMKHQNIIEYHKAFFDDADLYIVMELCSGSLYDILRFRYSSMSGVKAVPVMKPKEVASVLKQVLNGLLYIHNDGIIHRDIKSANILYNDLGLIKIADFGVSGKLNVSIASREARTTFVGTPSYISPEVILGYEYDQKADIWSLGIMSLEMASGVAPYSDFKPIKILSEILKRHPPTLSDVSISKDQFKKYPKSFNKFVTQCLQKEPAERKLCDELLNFCFIVNYAKGPSYIISSLLHNNSLNILELKLESKEYTGDYQYEPSEEEDALEHQEDSNSANDDAAVLKKVSSLDSSSSKGIVSKHSSHNHVSDRMSPRKDHALSAKKFHLVLHLRNLDDNELQNVEFDVGPNDDWAKWANDMWEKNLILKEHVDSMANALRLVMENDFAALTFKLDKNADPSTLDKEKLIGYVQLKVVKI